MLYRFGALTILLGLFATTALADRSKKALKDLSQGKFEDVIVTLTKDLAKDSLNPSTHYIYSLLYTKPAFFGYNVDQAHSYILKSARIFESMETKQKSGPEKLGINASTILHQKILIDSLAYDEARQRHTIDAYEYFMATYHDADQKALAEAQRDILAYDEALRKNTWQAYERFFTQYPGAKQVREARSRYDRLIFEDKTKGKSLASYRKFLSDFPDTPYRSMAEKAILEMAAIDNHPTSYTRFLQEFPNTTWRKLVLDLMYHADKSHHQGTYFQLQFPHGLAKDSLAALQELEVAPWIAVFENGKYGFMNVEGKMMLPPAYEGIYEAYLCGNIEADYIITSDTNGSKSILNRAGKPLYSGKFDSCTDIGAGLLLLKTSDGSLVLQKSGAVLFEGDFSEIEVIANSLLLVRNKSGSGVLSLLGKPLVDASYENISQSGDFLIIEKGNRKAVLSIPVIYKIADKDLLSIELKYEDAEVVRERYMLVAEEDLEGVIDTQQKWIVPIKNQQITPLPFGWLLRTKDGFRIIHDKDPTVQATLYNNILGNYAWTALKQSGKWLLRSNIDENYVIANLDSIALIGRFAAFFEINGLKKLLFNTISEIQLKSGSVVSVIGASKSTNSPNEYYQVKEPDRCVVYNQWGKQMFAERVDYVNTLMPGYFETSYRGRKGIIDTLGRFALETKYHAVGAVTDKLAMIISDGKFGLIDLPKKRTIGASYDERLKVYNEKFLVAVQGGKKGLISAENARKQLNFDYDEIQFWTDTLALARRAGTWRLVDIYTGKVKDDQIASFKLIGKAEGNLMMIYLTGTGWGIMDSKRGTILKPVYNDIVNLGTVERPVYFTEQHLPNAEFYVVTYTDAQGNVIRSQAFRSDEYSKIYCDQ